MKNPAKASPLEPTRDFTPGPQKGAALHPPGTTPLDPTEKLYEFFLRFILKSYR
jgi:hypothetical protein